MNSLIITSGDSLSLSKPQGSTSCSLKFSAYTVCAKVHIIGLGLLASASQICSLSAYVLGDQSPSIYGSH